MPEARESWAEQDAELVKDFWRALEADRQVWCLTTDRGPHAVGGHWGRVTMPL